MTVLSRLENLRDSVTDEKKLPWPGDFVVSPVAALSIAPMGVTTPCTSFRKWKLTILIRNIARAEYKCGQNIEKEHVVRVNKGHTLVYRPTEFLRPNPSVSEP